MVIFYVVRIILGSIIFLVPFGGILSWDWYSVYSVLSEDIENLSIRLWMGTIVFLFVVSILYPLSKSVVGRSFDDLFGYNALFNLKHKLFGKLSKGNNWIKFGIFIVLFSISVSAIQHFMIGYRSLVFYLPLSAAAGMIVSWFLYFWSSGRSPKRGVVYVNFAPGQFSGLLSGLIGFCSIQAIFISLVINFKFIISFLFR